MNLDTNSGTWRTVEHHLNERLAKCREKNDRHDLNPADTAALRGEIAAIKDLLDLPEQIKRAARVQVDDPGYGVDSIDDQH